MVWKIQIFPFVLFFVECFPHVHTALWHLYYRLPARLCSITAMDWASLDPFKSPAAFSVSFSFFPDAWSTYISTIWCVIKRRDAFSLGNAEKRLQAESATVSAINSILNVACPPFLCTHLCEWLFSSWILGCWVQHAWYWCYCFMSQLSAQKIPLTFMPRFVEAGEPSRGSSSPAL